MPLLMRFFTTFVPRFIGTSLTRLIVTSVTPANAGVQQGRSRHAMQGALRVPSGEWSKRHVVRGRDVEPRGACLAAPERSRRRIHSSFHVHSLVWFERHETMVSAIQREKAIKAWKRAWKLELIEGLNPDWHDLYPDLL